MYCVCRRCHRFYCLCCKCCARRNLDDDDIDAYSINPPKEDYIGVLEANTSQRQQDVIIIDSARAKVEGHNDVSPDDVKPKVIEGNPKSDAIADEHSVDEQHQAPLGGVDLIMPKSTTYSKGSKPFPNRSRQDKEQPPETVIPQISKEAMKPKLATSSKAPFGGVSMFGGFQPSAFIKGRSNQQLSVPSDDDDPVPATVLGQIVRGEVGRSIDTVGFDEPVQSASLLNVTKARAKGPARRAPNRKPSGAGSCQAMAPNNDDTNMTRNNNNDTDRLADLPDLEEKNGGDSRIDQDLLRVFNDTENSTTNNTIEDIFSSGSKKNVKTTEKPKAPLADIFHDDTDIFSDLAPKSTVSKKVKPEKSLASIFDDDNDDLFASPNKPIKAKSKPVKKVDKTPVVDIFGDDSSSIFDDPLSALKK